MPMTFRLARDGEIRRFLTTLLFVSVVVIAMIIMPVVAARDGGGERPAKTQTLRL